MGNILRSQCSSENGLCMCLRSPGTAEADGEFVESREVSVPSSGGVASGLSEERSAGRKKQPRPSSKARRKHAAASAKLSGGDATPEQTAKSPACSSGSAAAAVGAALAKNENSEETVAAGTSAPRSEEEDNVSGASELVWLADSLTLPVDETVALRIQRQQPLEVQRQLLESLFGRWQGEGKGLSFDELAAPRRFLGTSTSCQSANEAEEVLFQGIDSEGVLSAQAFVAAVEALTLNREAAASMFRGLQPRESPEGLCLELPDVRLGLRQLAETEMRASWVGESQLESLLDELCRNSAYHILLEEFLRLADRLAVTVRCLSLLYSQYEDSREPFQEKEDPGTPPERASPSSVARSETKKTSHPRERRPSLFRRGSRS